MGAYFSFERMITPTFVKMVYFLGFVALTVAGVGTGNLGRTAIK